MWITDFPPKNHWYVSRVQLNCDGTRWRTGREVKGKLANGVGSQNPSHYLGTWCIQHYYRWCAHLDWSPEVTPPADLNGLVCFAERRNMVSARVRSHFKRSLPTRCNIPGGLSESWLWVLISWLTRFLPVGRFIKFWHLRNLRYKGQNVDIR